jgi:DNA polymerase-3 subunit alpha
VGEFDREEKLAFEKEVTGIYITGHPLQEYEARWKKHITAVTTDFQQDEETGQPRLEDGAHVTVGGMILEKTIKYTKTNQTMAFLILEDLLGTVEVIVFPKSYEKYSPLLQEDAKVFLSGRVSGEEDKASKLILEKLVPFSEVSSEVWLQFADKEAYRREEQKIQSHRRRQSGEGQAGDLSEKRACGQAAFRGRRRR